jgi:hypothetical protein
MLRSPVWLIAGCLAAACSKSEPAPAAPASPHCRAAAETLAAFSLGNYAPREEREAAVKPIEAECARAGLTDAEATCLAAATSKQAALACPRVLTDELRALDRVGGRGKCRPALLALHFTAEQELAKAPPEQLAQAREMIALVKGVVAESCARDAWPDDVFACFDELPLERSAECLERLPLETQQRLQVEFNVKARERFEAERRRELGLPPEQPALPDGVAATGNPTCDAYLAARAAFEKCEAVPPSTRSVVLAGLAPLEGPWRKLPAGSLANAPSIEPLCTAAHDQLRQSAGPLGCE